MRDIVSSNIAFLMEAKKRAIGGFPLCLQFSVGLRTCDHVSQLIL